MALLNPTFLLALVVLIYLSTFVLFAILRILTGISIQRIGYFSLRRLAYTPRDGLKVEIRGLGLNLHRPTFAQPTWISIVISELVATVDVTETDDGAKAALTESDADETEPSADERDRTLPDDEPADKLPLPSIRRTSTNPPLKRSQTWKRLARLRERMKMLQKHVNWIRMVDIVATNTTVNVVGVGTVQFGNLTVAVDTRRKLVDRARFFFAARAARKKQDLQAEWIMTLKSVLFTVEGKEPLEVLDNATLNLDAYLSETFQGLRDACIALKLGRVHVPYDDIKLSIKRYKEYKNRSLGGPNGVATINPSTTSSFPDFDDLGSMEDDLMQVISESKEFITALVKGVKEVQFAVSFIGLSKKAASPQGNGNPLQLTASMKEVGIDLHRLDPKSPVHQMYFPSQDIAHEALAAALSISIGVDDGQGKPERLLYIPMATTTVRTTLPSKTVKLARDGNAGERDANILFANSVVTSPSIDLDPRHLPLIISLLQSTPRPPRPHRQQNPKGHLLMSRLLPKATVKLSMHEPVIRIALPPVEQTAEADDFDLIISSISSISLDMESFHSTYEEMHYSLVSTTRLQSHSLYYQTSSGNRLDLIQTEAFDLKVQVSAAPDIRVVANGNLQSSAVRLVRSEITDGLQEIIRQLRLDVDPRRRSKPKQTTPQSNFLRRLPSWLLHFQIQTSDLSLEVAGIDEHLSDDSRGVSLQLDTLTTEYRAQRLDGLKRHPSRRRASNRSLTPDTDFTRPPASPSRKKQQNHGDGRRLAFNVKGFEAYMIEAADKLELDPFLRMPRFDISLSTTSDSQGPLLQLHANCRSILVHYSLYRHYAVGLAAQVLRKAFAENSRKSDQTQKASLSPRLAPRTDYLVPPDSPSIQARGGTTTAPEMFTVDVKVALAQIKGDMPSDPPVMLQVHGVEAGRHRWSPPFFTSRLARLYVGAPRMHRVWARVVSIKTLRVDYRRSRHKVSSGVYNEERMLDIVSEATRVSVPHETVVYHITDNFVNVFKSIQQLHHRFKTGTNEYILEKKPEGPKKVPKVSLRSRNVLFELEDGAFEWKLGMIYRVGRIEQVQRIAREEAFELKMKRIREEESRRESTKLRARSTYHSKGLNQPTSAWTGSRTTEGSHKQGLSGGQSSRSPRYDPEANAPNITTNTKLLESEALESLNLFNSQSWKRRITRAYATSTQGMREVRSLFWGPSHLPEDLEDDENILEVPERPALMSALVSDLQIIIDKPSFPLQDLPDFLHSVGKGMPRDMQYSFLVPMHVQIDLDEARVCLRDYPLPFIHVPPLKNGQSPRLRSLSLKTNFVIAEEFRGIESTRKIRVPIIPPGSSPGGSGHIRDKGFSIDVRRTIGPVKSYSDMHVEVNTALPTRITWAPCYQPAMQDMMMVLESFTKPQLDPSERVGFWDKIRLNFHSRIRVAWKGAGDVHLALKGTRDPYLLTGNGAGFLMCWRNDVRLGLNVEDDPKRVMTIDSGEYVLAVPDYSHQVREDTRRSGDYNQPIAGDTVESGASFKKVAMKLSGNVQWMIGLVFEQAIVNEKRNFDFRPHYDIVLKAPLHAKSEDGLPYDALRGFRSQHIHLSIAIRAPVTRDWAASDPQPSKSYNTVHFSPRFFTHFFAWWGLFGSPLSLPIRQGRLFPGREMNSKKFGRHLATVKYNLLLAPLFLSHIYKHRNVDPSGPEDSIGATGLKVRFDSFMLDLHQRREEFSTRDRGRKTKSRTTGIRLHAAQLDLVSADVRAVSATMDSLTESLKKASMHAPFADHDDESPDFSRFTIPDNDPSWIDMDDFVELDWVSPAERNPDVKILPLACAPRLTYFRQTDIGGIISGDPDRTSPFGQEPTHFCIMSHDDDPKRVQAQLVQKRLDQLEEQMEAHAQNVGEVEYRVMQDDTQDAQLLADFEALRHHTGVLYRKKMFLEHMLQQMTGHAAKDGSASTSNGSGTAARSDTSLELAGGSMTLPSSAEFASEFTNRFVIHNMQLKWNNTLRNIVLRYIHQNSQRRGLVYYLSRPAVKFILDIVEEQAKAKSSTNGNAGNRNFSGKSPTPAPSESGSTAKKARTDIEDRIRSILDGKPFADAEDGAAKGTGAAMADLASGIAAEFMPQSSYHVRLIAPQIQLQSDKNKKHVVLVTAKGMDLKVVEVVDKARLSDSVSGLVQRRFLLNMDSAQFFVTHQKWFQTQFVSMYAGSRYGAPSGSSWPPWVPVEVIFDYQADPFGFRRVVQKTSAMLRYDKYNTLRLKYHDDVNTEDANADSEESGMESRMDNLWVEFPQARALCNSSQYYAMYVIALDLLMYSEPSEKTRSERLEKIMLASDFSDLSGAPEMIQRLQERVRQLHDIKSHLMVFARTPDRQTWEDRVVLEKDLAACEDELFFLMKAITTSQRKHEPTMEAAQSTALLKWTISVRDVVWHLIKDSMEPLVELQLRDLEYDRTDNADGSHINLIRVGSVRGLNLLPNATYPEIIAPYLESERGTLNDIGSREMMRVCWHMLEDIAGIPVMDHFEVDLFPMKIQLEREVGKQLFEYIFPHVEGNPDPGARDDSPMILKQQAPGQNDDDDDISVTSSSHVMSANDKGSSFGTRPGSLELRLQPTLNSQHNGSQSPKKALSVHTGDSHSFRLFKSSTAPRMSRKASKDSLKGSHIHHHRPGVGRTGTGLSLKDNASSASESKKMSRFVLRTKAGNSDEKNDHGPGGSSNNPIMSDDLSKMMERASRYMSFAYIKMPSVDLCLSYKGKESRNFEDVHDFVFRMPQIEWRNKTWSNLDLALAVKKAVMRALISHTGAIIGNKFSRHRPTTAQQNRLRELASSSAIIGQGGGGGGGSSHGGSGVGGPASHSSTGSPYARSINSDDSSSIFGTSPMDFSRSPPRSLRSVNHEGLGVRSTSRSSSVASHRTGSSAPPREVTTPGVPSFLMMTPPTPQEATGRGFESDAARPPSRQSLNPFGNLLSVENRVSSSPNLLGGRGQAGPAEGRRRSAGGTVATSGSSYIKGKLSALTSKLARENTVRGGSGSASASASASVSGDLEGEETEGRASFSSSRRSSIASRRGQ